MHKTAFIITNVRLNSPDESPTESQLRKAASQAILTAWKAQTYHVETNFEGFSIGNRQHRFIKGEFRTNSKQFRNLVHQNWPELSYHVMSEGKGPVSIDSEYEYAAARDMPMDILDNSWNTGYNLVSLALENRASHGTQHSQHGLIYPDVLLNTGGIVSHSLGYPTLNIFGETDEEYSAGESRRAHHYLPHLDPAQAHFSAMSPINRILRATFEADYVREMAKYDDHIVLEADWNM